MKKKFWIYAIFSLALSGLLFTSCSSNDDEEEPEPTLNASFECEGYFRPAPQEVVFTNKSTLAVSYEWDFGDGETSTEENPVHTYQEKGEYTATLTATGEDGSTDEYSKTMEFYGTFTGFKITGIVVDMEFFGDVPNSADPDDGGRVDPTFSIEDSDGNVIVEAGQYYPDYAFDPDNYNTAVGFSDDFDALPVTIDNMDKEYKLIIWDYDLDNNFEKNYIGEGTFSADLIIPDGYDPYPAMYNCNSEETLSFNLDWIEQ